MNKDLRNNLEITLGNCTLEGLGTMREKLLLWENNHSLGKLWASTKVQKPCKEAEYCCRDCVSIGSVVICYDINYSLNDFWHEDLWIDGCDEKVTFGDIGFLLGRVDVICRRKRKNSVKEV